MAEKVNSLDLDNLLDESLLKVIPRGDIELEERADGIHIILYSNNYDDYGEGDYDQDTKILNLRLELDKIPSEKQYELYEALIAKDTSKITVVEIKYRGLHVEDEDEDDHEKDFDDFTKVDDPAKE